MTGAAAALLLVSLLFALAVLVRRGRAPPVEPRLAITTRQPLGKDSGVALLRCNGRDLLVGYGTSGVTLLLRDPLPGSPP